jgi:3-oxoacyl-[acyl-carrier protein] reductase
MGVLDGRVAIVTGAARGIGRGEALELASHGAKVLVNDLGGEWDGTGADSRPAQQVVDEIVAAGGEAAANYDDVADWSASKKMVDEAIERWGTLDILVNNAGILRDRTIKKMTLDEWNGVIETNLNGVFYCSKMAAEMLADGGRIINVSSIAGLVGFPGQANYAAAKAGVLGMTRVIAKELAKRGITVNAVAPGVVQTPMLGEIKAEVMAEYEKQIPVGRVGRPEDVANAVLFFASEESSYITGQVLPVTGGWY